MLPTDRTRVDYVCVEFLHEATEPIAEIACDGAAARLSASVRRKA
jgi:hypothetical protein